MTTQPKSMTAPEAAQSTHAWRDTLVFMGGTVLLAVLGLVLVISLAALFH